MMKLRSSLSSMKGIHSYHLSSSFLYALVILLISYQFCGECCFTEVRQAVHSHISKDLGVSFKEIFEW